MPDMVVNRSSEQRRRLGALNDRLWCPEAKNETGAALGATPIGIAIILRMNYFVFAGGICLALLAGLLAITKGSLDLYVFDRYFLVLPSRLLFVSALLVLAALAMWDGKISH